jgi:hypothetical protein
MTWEWIARNLAMVPVLMPRIVSDYIELLNDMLLWGLPPFLFDESVSFYLFPSTARRLTVIRKASAEERKASKAGWRAND